MSKQYYDVGRGLQVDGGPVVIQGAGVPGAAGDASTAPVGSIYIDTTSGKTHFKDTAGAGTDKWSVKASEGFVLSNAGSASWRDPVDVILTATFANIAAVKADADADDILDGVAVTVGMRVLPIDLTTGNENVYIVGGSTGAWTFTEDTNVADEGDRLVCQFGSEAGREYGHNGTSWIFVKQSSLDEEGFIRTFIGKTGAGSETPSYTNENFITDGDSLETAVSNLDGQAKTNADNIGTNDTDITNLQNEDGFIQAFVGKAAGNDTPVYSSNNYVTDTEDLETAIGDLDTQAKVNADEILQARTEITSNNITTETIVDSVNVDANATVKYIIYAQGNLEADAHLKYVTEVLATHDGHNVGGTDDATTADFNESGKLKLGNLGVTIDMDVTGAGAAQVMRLKITSSTAADLKIIREVIVF
jgi:hypothetical protein